MRVCETRWREGKDSFDLMDLYVCMEGLTMLGRGYEVY